MVKYVTMNSKLRCVKGERVLFDCRLKQVVRVRHTIPTVIDYKFHKNTELTYFISGSGTTNINGVEYVYKNNTFAVYNAGTMHNEIDPEPCDIIWMHFDYNISGVVLKEGLYYDTDNELLNCILRLRRSAAEQQPLSEAITESLLAQCITVAAHQQMIQRDGNIDTDWQKILNFIDDNINTQINFEKLANENHYSYHRFRHLFKERFGISCHAFLLSRRIEYAKHLLKNSSVKLTKVAFDCGFTGSSQFTNIFKKYTGRTPSQYRMENQTPHNG